MQLLIELVELAKKATPGEWFVEDLNEIKSDSRRNGGKGVVCSVAEYGCTDLAFDHNLAFITKANPAAILAIAEYVKGLENRIADAGKMMGWKRVEDELPEDDTLCLGSDDMGLIWTMHFEDGVFTPDTGGGGAIITHWMHLPAAPEAPHD